ncbi:hypothetical protein HDU67_007753 [Dinochytrium kinnereticum]|nr:hypothetical protein HDU67_007753 [Dinochytrium kinnereticum]
MQDFKTPPQDWDFPIESADWILIFKTKQEKFGTTSNSNASRPEAIDAWETLITRLLSIGLHVKVRMLDRRQPASGKLPGLSPSKTSNACSRLAVFIYCPDQLLHRLVFKSKVLDWIANVGEVPVEPPKAPESIVSDPTEVESVLDGLDDTKLPVELGNVRITTADRLRLIHELIVGPTYEAGAGVVVGAARSPKGSDSVGAGYVEALFALHDTAFCNVGHVSPYFVFNPSKIGFYFAFLQFYIKSLIPISVISILFYFFAAEFSSLYAMLVIIWSAAFIVLWKREAILLAHRWGTLNQAAAARTRPDFQPDKIHVDVATGERVPYYPEWKRMIARAALTFPIIMLFTAIISIVSLAILVVEVFFSEYYDGPLKDVLAMIPVLLYVACIPLLSSWYQHVAVRLTEIENPSTKENYDKTLSSMSFILSSLLTHLSILLVGFVFIPTSDLLANVFRAFGVQVSISAEEALRMGPDTLRARVVYFSLTAQIINQFTEVGLPLIMQRIQGRKTTGGSLPKSATLPVNGEESKAKDLAEEALIKRVKMELERPPYDLYEDYAEMANQFGLIVMFSGAWPLVPVVCLINNFVEMRSDALKICKAARRPNPERADNISPWMDIMALMSMVGSIASAAFIVLYQSWDKDTAASTQLMDRLPWIITASLFSEHIFLFLNRVFETVFGVTGFHVAASHPHQHVNVREGDGSRANAQASKMSNLGFFRNLVLQSPLKLVEGIASSMFSGVASHIRTRQRRVRFDAGRGRLAVAGIDIGAGRHGGVVKWRGKYARTASFIGSNTPIAPGDEGDVSMISLPESVSSLNDGMGLKRVSVLEDVHPGRAVMYGLCLQAIHEAVKDE